MSRVLGSDSSDENTENGASSRGKKRKAIRVYESSSEDDSDSSEFEESADDQCSICLGQLGRSRMGRPENCQHTFCLDCILEWAKTVNTCPVDRRPFNQIFVQDAKNGPITEEIYIEDKKTEEPEEIPPTYCEVCQQCDREDELLLCDECDDGYHLNCLSPPLEAVPIDEWFCPQCAQDEGENINANPPSRHSRRRAILDSPEHRGTDTLGEVALRAARAGPSSQTARTVGSQRRRSGAVARASSRGRSKRRKPRKKKQKTQNGSSATGSTRKRKKVTKRKKRRRSTASSETQSGNSTARPWNYPSHDLVPKLSIMGNEFALNDFDFESEEEDDSTSAPPMRRDNASNHNVLDGIFTNLQVLGSTNVKIERGGRLTLQPGSDESEDSIATKSTRKNTVTADVLGFPNEKQEFNATRLTQDRAARDVIQKRLIEMQRKTMNRKSSKSRRPTRDTYQHEPDQTEWYADTERSLRNFKIPKKPKCASSTEDCFESVSTGSNSKITSKETTKSCKPKSVSYNNSGSSRSSTSQVERDNTMASSRNLKQDIPVCQPETGRNVIKHARVTVQQERRNVALMKLLAEQKKALSAALEDESSGLKSTVRRSRWDSMQPAKSLPRANETSRKTPASTNSNAVRGVHSTSAPTIPSTHANLSVRPGTFSSRPLASGASSSMNKPMAVVSPSVSLRAVPLPEPRRSAVQVATTSTADVQHGVASETIPRLPAAEQGSKMLEGIQRLKRTNLIVDAVKSVLLPLFKQQQVTKEQYKIILKKCVDKIKASNKDIVHQHVRDLVREYVIRCHASH